ncbi:lipoprotein [Aurantibacter aestuarii]
MKKIIIVLVVLILVTACRSAI